MARITRIHDTKQLALDAWLAGYSPSGLMLDCPFENVALDCLDRMEQVYAQAEAELYEWEIRVLKEGD